MEVKLKSKTQILKSFLVWLPFAVMSFALYFLLSWFVMTWLLENYGGLDVSMAKKAGGIGSALLSVLLAALYLSWLGKRILTYRLAIDNDELLLRGKSGWKSIDRAVPLSTIQKMTVGESQNFSEKLSRSRGLVKDPLAYRLTFYSSSGEIFHLDFAARVFDDDSFHEFWQSVKDRGIETNVRS